MRQCIDFYLDSPYLYHDVSVWPGRLPQKPSLSTAPADYARLDASYAGQPERRASNYGYPSLPGFDGGGHVRGLFLFTPTVEMNLPFRRQEYYAVKGVRWGFETDVWRRLSDDGMIQDLSLVDSVAAGYPAGRTTRIRSQQAVFGPSLPDSRAGFPGRTPIPWVFRDGDSLTVGVPMYSDGGNMRRGDSVIDSEHTSLSRDGWRSVRVTLWCNRRSRCRRMMRALC